MDRSRVAVIGGGYAGCAAAVTLADAGHAVTLFEAATTLGGRARRVDVRNLTLDNGQHLILGAYTETLALIRRVHGPEIDGDLLLRLPLTLEAPDGLRLRALALPAPWHLLGGLLLTHVIPWPARLRTIAFFQQLRRRRFRCSDTLSVSTLLAHQPKSVVLELWKPLCLAALNTPIEEASAQAFLNVLRASFDSVREASDMVLPRVDLSALFPDAAARHIGQRNGQTLRGRRAARISATSSGYRIDAMDTAFAAVVIAVGPHQLARLLEPSALDGAALDAWRMALDRFTYEPIVTVYLRYGRSLGLAQPIMRLNDDPGQWVFDREQTGGPPGLASVVISASGPHMQLTREALVDAADAQLKRYWPMWGTPLFIQVITEKRATYAARPGLKRPSTGVIAPRVYLAGDYVDTEFPATLEAATRSGVAAARAIIAAL